VWSQPNSRCGRECGDAELHKGRFRIAWPVDGDSFTTRAAFVDLNPESAPRGGGNADVAGRNLFGADALALLGQKLATISINTLGTAAKMRVKELKRQALAISRLFCFERPSATACWV
jgi:hypothetical protein